MINVKFWSYGGMYILPSPVFFKGEDGKFWLVGIWQGVILTVSTFFKPENNIL